MADIKIPKLLSLIVVCWTDANSQDDGWILRSDLDGELAPVVSVGWLMRNEKATISIAGSYSEKFIDRTLVIPKCIITNITVLKSKYDGLVHG